MKSLRSVRLFVAAAVMTSLPSVASAWSTWDDWGSWTDGTATVANQIWGSGHGSQLLWVNSATNWGVWADHPNTGGVKSYPNVLYYFGRNISAINTLQSGFNVSVPGDGAWEVAYDIWDENKSNEIMIWMNSTGSSDGCGNNAPISYNYSSSGCAAPTDWNVYIGWNNWNVFRGHNGSNNVYSFVRTSYTNDGAVDIKEILNWLRNKGWLDDVKIGDISFGYEITSSSGGRDFVTNSYWINKN
ncbi:GH12 family glycosyl hydrolase domain-containing protein [Hydrocarboniphaga sp.]|uniref:GH12 family glycosyl hydrolase domain-containing protein n=1 Tax=Hydrocarboniphaga sp. TaxID=2033016 RepID=UPI003D124AA1